jgi:hypothetical protein
MRRILAALTLTALVLGGCSDDGDGDEDDGGPATTEEAAPTTEPDRGPCPYVTTEAVAEAFGLPVELLQGGDDGCDFVLGDAATLLIGPDLAVAADDCDPATVVAADPDGEACLVDEVPAAFAGPDGAVALTVTGEVAPDASRDALVRLLPQVTPG